MKLWILGAMLAGGGAICLLLTDTAAGTGALPEYWYSSDPTLELVHIRFRAAQRPTRRDYRLYADGTLTVERASTHPDGGGVYWTKEYHLTNEELAVLIHDAVVGELLAITDAVRTQIRARERRQLSPDSGSVQITFSLPHVRLPGGEGDQPMRMELTVRTDIYQSSGTRGAGIPQLESIKKLIAALRAYAKKAQKTQS